MEILQLSLPALEEKIVQELESNIALEIVEPSAEESETEDSEANAQEDTIDPTEDIDAQISELPPRTASQGDGRDPKMDAMANIRARQESLSEQLLHQWSFAEVTSSVKVLGSELIGLLDADGFLTYTDSDLNLHLTQGVGLHPNEEELNSTILALQKWLDPPGIAARSLQESFIIQIDSFFDDDPKSWADVRVLIESHLDQLIENKLPQIATDSGLGLERVKLAMSRMHELTISPGKMIATESVLPVIPDAIVEFDDQTDEYIVGICNGKLPAIRISNTYEKMSRDKHADEPTRDFIKRNVNAARWIIDAVDQRKMTLQNIVKIVVERQRDFLDQGDAFLRPLPMIEVADILGIHVATVSRAVADKWIQTPRGIFHLRRFFSGGYDSDKKGEMSWEAVKTRLKEIVVGEDKKSPLSDEAIAKSLRSQGIEIARRTVVKYRQQLSIPAARLRKEY
jgi:RNA polymerase sigma-54 factor